jgi:lycopene cyclase domain-containing protein
MTYASVAVLFLAVAGLTALAAALRRRLSRLWWSTTIVVALVLVVLTAVFDSVMISADLFRYDTGSLLGPRVLLVPIEDFAWPVAAAIALPGLWELLGSRRRTAVTAAGTEEPAPTMSGGSPPHDR